MRKIVIVAALFGISLFAIFCNEENANSTAIQVKKLYQQELKSLQNQADTFLLLAEKRSDFTLLREKFTKARTAYKSVEFLTEYYYPATSKAINGAAIPEIEADNPNYPTEPSGFQVIEEMIFGEEKTDDYTELITQSKLLRSAITRLQTTAETLELTDAHIWDAFRLQCFRIITLGISGYDSPVAQYSLEEASASLKSLVQYISLYNNKKKTVSMDSLINTIAKADLYLQTNNQFVSFNRALFITDHMNTVTRLLNSVQVQLEIPYFNEPRLLAANASSLFDSSVWNTWYYSTNYRKPANAASLEKLGHALFYEPLLSGNNIRTCASCHQPEKAFTDGLPKNKSFDGKKIILRNTPSILFSALQAAQFADTRVAYLEDQAKQVIENPEEMHGNLTSAIQKLKGYKNYDSLFTQAFGKTEPNEKELQTAIAAYIRSKSVLNSRFDDYMRGNKDAVSSSAIKGFNLFMGKAKCGTCHFMPLFNGTVPPNFIKIETEVLGVPEKFSPPYILDKDLGKYNIVAAQAYKHSFKTSTARNAAFTAPYMHNGAIKNLEELIEFYNVGGGVGLGLEIPNQTLPGDPLNLTKEEKQSLIDFLKTLTSR
jgi:cytochrome c peroxidase